jgi:hypothetical protein
MNLPLEKLSGLASLAGRSYGGIVAYEAPYRALIVERLLESPEAPTDKIRESRLQPKSTIGGNQTPPQ